MRFLHPLLIAAALFLSGCSTSPRIVEGTHFCLGCYLPYEGGLVGLDLLEYTSGCVVKSLPTNAPFEVSRVYSSTNTWFFGLARTVERTELKVKAEPAAK